MPRGTDITLVDELWLKIEPDRSRQYFLEDVFTLLAKVQEQVGRGAVITAIGVRFERPVPPGTERRRTLPKSPHP